MADIDLTDGLLALVGDDADDTRAPSSSPPPPARAPAAAATRKKPRRRRVRSDDSDAGYGSSDASDDAAPRRQRRSAALPESPDDDDDDNDEEDDLGELSDDSWASDLMGGADDRAYLAGLPELDRERILAERAEKRQAIREQKALQRKLRESMLLSRTERAKSDKKRRLEALRDKRDLSRRQEKKRSRASVSDDSDDDHAYRRRRKASLTANRSPSPPPKPPARTVTMDELQTMQLTRDHIEKWCFADFFEDVARGAFVRLRVGSDANGVPQYRIAEIKEVTTYKRAYLIQRVKTNKAFLLKHGRAEREFLADIFSNSPFTESEFMRWRLTCENEDVSLPTVDDAQDKAKHLATAAAHVFSDAEITQILERKRALASDAKPHNLASHKADLLKSREIQASLGNRDEVREIDAKLDALRQLADEQRRGMHERASQLRAVEGASQSRTTAGVKPGAATQVLTHQDFRLPDVPATVDTDTAPMSLQDLFASGPKLNLDLDFE